MGSSNAGYVAMCVMMMMAMTMLMSAEGPEQGPAVASPGECSSEIRNLNACMPFLKGAAEPVATCCSNLSSLVERSPQCTCQLYNTTSTESMGVNATQARLLLAACHVLSTDLVGLCSVHGIAVPTTPAMAPTSSMGRSSSPSSTITTTVPSVAPSSVMAPVASTTPSSTMPPTPVTSPSSGPKTAIIAVVVIVAVAAICSILVCCYKARKPKGAKQLDTTESWPREVLQSKARVFSLQELQEATGNFNSRNKLGVGGFSIVYKGTLSDGEEVAIKKLKDFNDLGKEQFLNEVNLITGVQHKNLIRLLGCCVEGSERILVYVYLPNKSLDFFLFGDNQTLNWRTRYGIIRGIAKGLAYLHEESHNRIVHRDIKPSNILLDNQLNPVIADFGIARLVQEDATHVNTRFAGTKGYVAPEYAFHGELSEKADVFSFGVVSLQILTGMRNRGTSVLTSAWEKYQEGKAVDLVDEKLGNTFSHEQAIRVLRIALLCTQEDPKQRPAMSRVTVWLGGSSYIDGEPTLPTFLDYYDSIARVNESDRFASASSASVI